MKKILKNHLGFSLAEVMVAAGLMGVVSLGLMKMMETSNKSAKKMRIDFNINSLSTEVRQALQDNKQCDEMLMGYNPAGTGSSLAVLRHDIRDSSGADIGDKTLLTKGANYGTAGERILIDDIIVANYVGTGDPLMDPGTANLIIRYTRVGAVKTIIGSKSGNIKFSVRLLLDGSGNVASCYGNSNSYIDAACASLGGVLNGNGECVNLQLGLIGGSAANVNGPLSATSSSVTGEMAAASAKVTGDVGVDGRLRVGPGIVGGGVGDIVATGNLSAIGGTFTGDVTAVNGAFTGDVGGVNANFSGNGVFTGDVTGANAGFLGNGVFGGNVSGVNGTFSGVLSGDSATITNGLTAKSAVISTSLNAGTGTITGALSVGGNITITGLPTANNHAATISWVKNSYLQNSLTPAERSSLMAQLASSAQNDSINIIKEAICNSTRLTQTNGTVTTATWNGATRTCSTNAGSVTLPTHIVLNDACPTGEFMVGVLADGTYNCLAVDSGPVAPPGVDLHLALHNTDDCMLLGGGFDGTSYGVNLCTIASSCPAGWSQYSVKCEYNQKVCVGVNYAGSGGWWDLAHPGTTCTTLFQVFGTCVAPTCVYLNGNDIPSVYYTSATCTAVVTLRKYFCY